MDGRAGWDESKDPFGGWDGFKDPFGGWDGSGGLWSALGMGIPMPAEDGITGVERRQ